MAKWSALIAIALTVSMAHAEQVDSYRLGPGDTISIQVMDHPEYSVTLAIRPDGRVSYPTTGELDIAGLTVEELSELIKETLTKRLRDPEVWVNVVGFRPMNVFVLGAVANPGQVQVPQRGMLVRDVLARVSGLSPNADPAGAVLYPEGAEPIRLNLAEEMAVRPETGTTMKPGDFLYVPQRIVNRVTVAGQVGSPGEIVLEPGATVLDLVLKAGGLTQQADLKDSWVIRKDGTIEQVDLSGIYSGEEAGIELRPDDALIVGKPGPLAPVLVLGQVRTSGRFTYDPSATLADLLAMAGGPTPEADAKHSRILRLDGSATPVDLQAVLDGQADEKLRDVGIQPGDILMVPKQMDRVALLGEVSTPGFYGVEKGTRLSEVLTKAGGVLVREGKGKIGYLVRRTQIPDNESSQQEVEVRRLDISGVLFGGNTEDDVELHAGDLVYVPGEKEPGFWELYRRDPWRLLGIFSLLERIF